MNRYLYFSPTIDPDAWQRICDKADRDRELEDEEPSHSYNPKEDD